MAFSNQVQRGFAGFEKHLNLPAFAIYTDNFFLAKRSVCAYESKPVFTISLVTNSYDFCRNRIVLSYHNVNAKQIS